MRMCDENYRPRITLRRLEPQPPPPGFYQTELADPTAGLIGYNDRPRPSTIYPQREPVGEYYGSHFVLKFPGDHADTETQRGFTALDAERRQGQKHRVQDPR